jgi:hypothetical protein
LGIILEYLSAFLKLNKNIMKKIFLIFLLIFTVKLTYSNTKHALIIAIGDYPRSTGWGSISSANDVDLIKQALLNQEFEESNIITIIDGEATKKSILEAFNKIKLSLKKGDILVVHYSGHGQQIFDDNGDEVDGKDEAIIPYDAMVSYSYNYKGENHIRDDELSNIITDLRNTLGKDGQLLFLLDSCHSGSSARGGKARGSKAVFAPENWKQTKNGINLGSDVFDKVKVSSNAAPYIMISGASANELNYEHPDGFGALSYAFSEAMNDLGEGFSYRQLFSKIAVKMNVFSPNQNPTIEGDLDLMLFKNQYNKQQAFFEVKKILRSDVIKIQAGKLQGVFKGTTVFILPEGTLEVDEKKVLAKGKVVLAKYNESNILLEAPLKSKNEKEYAVFIDQKSYGDISLNVYLDDKILNNEVKKGVTNFLKDNNLGTISTDSIKSDIIISKKGELYSLNITNNYAEFESNSINRGKSDIEVINQKIFNYAQGSFLKKLKLDNEKYKFSFNVLPIEYDLLTEELGEIGEAKELLRNNILTVKEGVDNVVFQVTNHSKVPLYFTIIEINSKGEISNVLPSNTNPLNDQERLIEAGKTFVFKDIIFGYGPPYEKLMYKCFASPNKINIESTVSTRGEKARNNLNPLEKFIANSYKKSRSGSSVNVSGKIDAYTSEIIYEIVKE